MKGAQNSLVYSGSFTSSCRVFSGDYKRHILINQRRSTKDCVYLNGVLNNAVDLPHMQSVVQCQLVITLDRSIFLSLFDQQIKTIFLWLVINLEIKVQFTLKQP